MTNPFAQGPAPATATATPTAPASIPTPTPAAPAAPYVPPAGGDDPFSAPAPQRPRGPRVRDMMGRLLLIMPKKVEKVRKKNPRPGEDPMQDRMTADVVVLDGGPIAYGGRPEHIQPTQHDKVGQLPFVCKDMFVSGVGLISQCRDALTEREKGGRGMVLGRLTVGEARDADSSPPYLLTPYTDADREIGKAYLSTVDPFAA